MRRPRGQRRPLARQRRRLPGRHPPLSGAPLDARLERALAGTSGILFVCSGNVVRSAFAELYARHRGCPLPVGSAASHFRNTRLFPETALALRSRGVPPALVRAFRPRHIEQVAPSLSDSPLVLAMARMHLMALVPWPALHSRAFLLGSVLGEAAEIADPVLDGADFDGTFARIERCVDELVLRLRSAHGS